MARSDKPRGSKKPTPNAPDGYFAQSAEPLTALLFILPILVIYEIGVWVLGSEQLVVRNGADQWLRAWLSWIGLGDGRLLPPIVCGVLLGWHHLARRPWRVSAGVLGRMWLESLLLGLLMLAAARLQSYLFHTDVSGMAAAWLDPSRRLATRLIGYLGAGIFEELLFRLILLSLLAWAVQKCGAPTRVAWIAGAIVSSLLFAAAHYRIFVGSGADLDAFSFLFRFSAGLYFSALYRLRGFGIAVGTHAIYDICTLL